jgi:phenylalanyl-tRNA synthetase alpha subunit
VYFIDIAIPNNHNLHAKYAEKLAKYSELSIESKDQWKMDTAATIPITLSTNGIISGTLHKALDTLSLHPKTFIELQKATILNTCSIVRQFFNIS